MWQLNAQMEYSLTPNYDCGHPNQNVSYIIRKYNGSIEYFSSVHLNINVMKWITNLDKLI